MRIQLQIGIRSFFFICCMIAHGNHLIAQYTGLGSWNTLQLKAQLSKNWSVLGEAQLRSLHFYNQFHYYEYKAAAVYQLHPEIKLTLGAGSYQTYREGGNFILPKNNNEVRIWPQLSLHHLVGKLNIEQRYRSESRFTSSGYRNRFRYRLGLSIPVTLSANNPAKKVTLHLSNELFFTDREPYFERNRIQFGIGFRASKMASVQVGYLHQFDYRINDETGRDFLQIGYYFELNKLSSSLQKIDTNLRED
ncbi:MAG: DUF2490 domain-containing protein [Bacteroidia bacterium]|nr:DUF2490 domain-containing protein [Bacteroidia bacterium]